MVDVRNLFPVYSYFQTDFHQLNSIKSKLLFSSIKDNCHGTWEQLDESETVPVMASIFSPLPTEK